MSPGTLLMEQGMEVSCDLHPEVTLSELGSLMFTPCNTSVVGTRCAF